MPIWPSSNVNTYPLVKDGGEDLPNLDASTSNPPMDTRAIDPFRQGVELRRSADIFGNSQPKLWAGSFNTRGAISHQRTVTNFGQSVSYAEYFGENKVVDADRFNPVTYIELGDQYPLPIFFNQGPQTNNEGIIDPLSIPDRQLPNPESIQRKARGSRGELVEASGIRRDYGAQRVAQRIYFGVNVAGARWIEDGEELLGETPSGSVLRPGYDFPTPSLFQEIGRAHV